MAPNRYIERNITKDCGVLPKMCTDAVQHHHVRIPVPSGSEALDLFLLDHRTFLTYCPPSVFL